MDLILVLFNPFTGTPWWILPAGIAGGLLLAWIQTKLEP